MTNRDGVTEVEPEPELVNKASTTTAFRYITEAAEVLAALAPTLADAARAASMKAFVLLDGTLLPIDRIAADRPFYSGKHHKCACLASTLVMHVDRAFRGPNRPPGARTGRTCGYRRRVRRKGKAEPAHGRREASW